MLLGISILAIAGCYFSPLPTAIPVELPNKTAIIDPIDSGPHALAGHTWYLFGPPHSQAGICEGDDRLLAIIEVGEDGRITRFEPRALSYRGYTMRSFIADEVLVDNALHATKSAFGLAGTYLAETYGHSDGTQVGVTLIGQVYFGPLLVSRSSTILKAELDQSGETITGTMTVHVSSDIPFIANFLPNDSYLPPESETIECPFVGTYRAIVSERKTTTNLAPLVHPYYQATCPQPNGGFEKSFSVIEGRPLLIKVNAPTQDSTLSWAMVKNDPSFETGRSLGGSSCPGGPEIDLEITPRIGFEAAPDGTVILQIFENTFGISGDYSVLIIQAP